MNSDSQRHSRGVTACRIRKFRVALVVLCLAVPGLQPVCGSETLLARGQRLYSERDHKGSVRTFEELVRVAPQVSEHHHWLGKAYGRLAENSGWFVAMRLAKKTRKSFERAVELDPENVGALKDLMRYYQDAPGFLGGSEEKAEGIRLRLRELAADPPVSP